MLLKEYTGSLPKMSAYLSCLNFSLCEFSVFCDWRMTITMFLIHFFFQLMRPNLSQIDFYPSWAIRHTVPWPVWMMRPAVSWHPNCSDNWKQRKDLMFYSFLVQNKMRKWLKLIICLFSVFILIKVTSHCYMES